MALIAGPCAWESQEQCFKTIEFLHDKVDYIRGGIWKYRSNATTFQGNPTAISWVIEAKKKWDFKYIVEVYDEYTTAIVSSFADVFQIGSRNMTNTNLLKFLNNVGKPVLFKRHYAASLKEFVMHSVYLRDCDVTLCLRGCFSSFSQDKRFQPDFDDILRLRSLTDKKIIYDVSHSAGQVDLVKPSIIAAKAFGADGIMIEVHPSPKDAFSDANQQIDFEYFDNLRKAGLL